MREVHRYAYLDPDSDLMYWRVRYEPKTFRFEMPDGTPSLQCTPILYDLPAVLEAGGVVFLVEGEKDADSLIAEGLTATTVGAATQWATTDWSPLKDVYEVVILPDADERGRAFAEQAADDLAPFTRVKVIDLHPAGTDGEDVTDWLEEGGSGFGLLGLRIKRDLHEKSWRPPLREPLRGSLRDPLREGTAGLPYSAFDIVHALGGRMTGSGRGVAYCPAHDDHGSHNMGLSVSEMMDDERCLAYCHSDCDWRDILRAVSLIMDGGL